MRWRRKQDTERVDPRTRLFASSPASLGLPRGGADQVWAVMVDFVLGAGTASLVALIDGTTSLCTSGGGDALGPNDDRAVAEAAGALVFTAESQLAQFVATDDDGLPAPPNVRLWAFCHNGPRMAEATESAFVDRSTPLVRVFDAAQVLLAALREAEGVTDSAG